MTFPETLRKLIAKAKTDCHTQFDVDYFLGNHAAAIADLVEAAQRIKYPTRPVRDALAALEKENGDG